MRPRFLSMDQQRASRRSGEMMTEDAKFALGF
jgi:hypothetical protein